MLNYKTKFVLHYFDRNIIKKRWPKMSKDPMDAAANMVRRIALNSIRNQHKRLKPGWRASLARKPSRPGTPPHSWQPGSPPPFKMIYADRWGLMGTSRIVGMVGFGGTSTPVPGLHEHGGWARRRVLVPRQRRKVSGQFGKMAFVPTWMMVHYKKRPFMWPALLKAKSRYPRLWEGSLQRAA